MKIKAHIPICQFGFLEVEYPDNITTKQAIKHFKETLVEIKEEPKQKPQYEYQELTGVKWRKLHGTMRWEYFKDGVWIKGDKK